MTLKQLVEWGRHQLEQEEVPEAEASAWYLLQSCLGNRDFSFRRSDYFLHRDEEAGEAVKREYSEAVEKRKQRIPLEYITGFTEFMGLVFWVDENVLIPRQDTETLVEWVYPLCSGKRVLDLCSGSGCIGLSIAALGNPLEVVLSDISAGAVGVAKENWNRLKEECQIKDSTKVEVLRGDLWKPVQGRFDVIVSNPPYIESDTIPELMPEVRKFEPMGALDGGEDGLEFYRKIITDAPNHLNPGGILCFEIGYNQGESVSSLMRERGFAQVEIKKDIAGNDRVVAGKLAD